jgi:hypothetical protein
VRARHAVDQRLCGERDGARGQKQDRNTGWVCRVQHCEERHRTLQHLIRHEQSRERQDYVEHD